MKKLILMLVLVSSAIQAQELSFGGNMIFANKILGDNIETGAGFTANLNMDLYPGDFILGPSVSVYSFGDVTPIGGSTTREVESEFTYGIISGLSLGLYDLQLAYELPYETNKNHGVFFESMLSGKIKKKFNQDKNLGVYFSYDYFFNKDTFYYTSQAGIGLYYKFN